MQPTGFVNEQPTGLNAPSQKASANRLMDYQPIGFNAPNTAKRLQPTGFWITSQQASMHQIQPKGFSQQAFNTTRLHLVLFNSIARHLALQGYGQNILRVSSFLT